MGFSGCPGRIFSNLATKADKKAGSLGLPGAASKSLDSGFRLKEKSPYLTLILCDQNQSLPFEIDYFSHIAVYFEAALDDRAPLQCPVSCTK